MGGGLCGFWWHFCLCFVPWVGFWLGPFKLLVDICIRGRFVVRVCLVGFSVWPGCGLLVWAGLVLGWVTVLGSGWPGRDSDSADGPTVPDQ